MPMTPVTSKAALHAMLRRRHFRVEAYYSRTYLGVNLENVEQVIGCTRATRKSWVEKGLIVPVSVPGRPPCNHMFKLTKAGRTFASAESN